MALKNYGPCSVQNCNLPRDRYRQFTSLAYNKAQKKGTYKTYPYLKIGQQLCYLHYLRIVEPDRGQKSRTPELKNYSFHQ
ncbi:hypothetical protein Glove_166g229 [Diversispora epigaea]|uniref:Uncharacterized protein n=1 Tax=Diversispora epigaea TaxID=1348612 RepID=A0A397IYL6_9GLOM|nr:hypothetical protein Glove_166g229 [Diversispora epigaea]